MKNLKSKIGKLLNFKPKKEDKSIVIHASGSMAVSVSRCQWKFTVFTDGAASFTASGFTECENATSMTAHYLSIIKALEWTAANYPTQKVEINNCCQNIVSVFNGTLSRKSSRLSEYDKKAKEIQLKTNAVVVWKPKKEMKKAA